MAEGATLSLLFLLFLKKGLVIFIIILYQNQVENICRYLSA